VSATLTSACVDRSLSLIAVQIEAKTTAGETPLALACGGGSEECIRLLIEKGANFKDACIHSAAK